MILFATLLAAQVGMSAPAAGAVHTVRSPARQKITCRVEEAPRIKVAVTTNDIAYDYTRGARELTGLKTDTTSPYPPGSDTVTGGLRQDHPTIRTKMEWDVVWEDISNIGCMRYKEVNIEIHMQPKIFLAKEFDNGTCREAVLTHERKHVQVDREVMNKYAGIIGRSVQDIVNRVGALGPFDMKNVDAVKKQSSDYIVSTMKNMESAMSTELRARQQKVDSLEEYKYVGSFCKNVRVGK